MGKQQISFRQGVSMVGLFTIGSTLVLGISKQSKQDAWISILIAIAAILPIVYIYARILRRFPGMHLFDICLEVFGKVAGRIVIALFIWYAIHLGALVLRNFSEFIHVTTFERMPQTVSLMAFIVLVIWAVRRGPEALGRYSSIAIIVLITIVTMTVFLLIKDMRLENLLPIGENLHEVPRDALNNFTFPYGETVLFLAVLHTLRPGAAPGRAWTYGILIGGAVTLVGLFFRNLLVLGLPMLNDATFSSYTATSVIIAGGFVSRIENVIGANLMMAGLAKVGICLLAASQGVSSLVGGKDYRPYVAPLGLIMVALASVVYKNAMEMFEFLPVYSYYALPFQVLLPILICIAAEIRFLIKNKKGEGGAKGEAPAGQAE